MYAFGANVRNARVVENLLHALAFAARLLPWRCRAREVRRTRALLSRARTIVAEPRRSARGSRARARRALGLATANSSSRNRPGSRGRAGTFVAEEICQRRRNLYA
jgi:hypothetical protein